MPQVYDKDGRDIKGALRFEAVFDPMMVIVIAVHSDRGLNHKFKIPCAGTLPVHGYSYCAVNDCCTVNCCDRLSLGYVGVSYVATMRGTAGWRLKVPAPERVIRRYLGLEQRRALKKFQDGYREPPGAVSFEYIQMVSAF